MISVYASIMTQRSIPVIVSILLLALGIFLLFSYYPSSPENIPNPSSNLNPQNNEVVSDVLFSCDAGKSIHSIFRSSEVNLELSDGRSLSLSQTIAASGIRYTNDDESFIFWSKGETAFIEENGTTTFLNCAIKPLEQ